MKSQNACGQSSTFQKFVHRYAVQIFSGNVDPKRDRAMAVRLTYKPSQYSNLSSTAGVWHTFLKTAAVGKTKVLRKSSS
jgi:hypothetical protein